MHTDTIAAIATASGKGGIGIVRISGPLAHGIGEQVCQQPLAPRSAQFSSFFDNSAAVIDQGIAIFFAGPASFTGEDIVELQAHGGSIVLDLLLNHVLSLGARMARPGEFSERAFLNDKIDLLQAEAIADIIDSSSQAALRASMRSLSGEFSKLINNLVEETTRLRVYVEAAIDFPEEEIDFVSDAFVSDSLKSLVNRLSKIFESAKSGAVLNSGLTVAIIGKPNAGKSSLLNALASDDIAIVTEQAGTTRDILKQQIMLENIPLTLLDTAGLRKSTDTIEQEGIKRVQRATQVADLIIYLQDAHNDKAGLDRISIEGLIAEYDIILGDDAFIIGVKNKIDLLGDKPAMLSAGDSENTIPVVSISAKERLGLDLLASLIKEHYGINNSGENAFTARRRHVNQLQKALAAVKQGQEQLQSQQAGELLAEDLKQAQQALGEITGAVSSDDLLGEIFSSFCIGK